MKLTVHTPPPRSLRALGEEVLNARNQKLLEDALKRNAGDPPWRKVKEAEALDLLRLSQLAPPGRLRVEMLDLGRNLRSIITMRVPVACRPDAEGRLRVADFAVLGLTYPRDVIQQRLPGMAFVQILQPHGVWHANVGSVGQPLCLGANLPVGLPIVELVLMCYGALTLQTVMLDVRDPAGVLNGDAARWWLQNPDLIPLSATPFLRPDPPKQGDPA